MTQFLSAEETKQFLADQGLDLYFDGSKKDAAMALRSLANMKQGLTPGMGFNAALTWVNEHAIRFTLKEDATLRELHETVAKYRSRSGEYFRPIGKITDLIAKVEFNPEILPFLATSTMYSMDQFLAGQEKRSLRDIAEEYGMEPQALVDKMSKDLFPKAKALFACNQLNREALHPNFVARSFLIPTTIQSENGVPKLDYLVSPQAMLLLDFSAIKHELDEQAASKTNQPTVHKPDLPPIKTKPHKSDRAETPESFYFSELTSAGAKRERSRYADKVRTFQEKARVARGTGRGA